MHLTEIVGEDVQKLNLCERCATAKGVSQPTSFALSEMILGPKPLPSPIVLGNVDLRLLYNPLAASAGWWRRRNKFMQCAECKERAATVHICQIADAKMQTFDLCEDCARAKGLVNDPAAINLNEMMSDFGKFRKFTGMDGSPPSAN